MRRLTGQQEHLTLLDPDITELVSVNYTQEHATLVLIEPFLKGK